MMGRSAFMVSLRRNPWQVGSWVITHNLIEALCSPESCWTGANDENIDGPTVLTLKLDHRKGKETISGK
jgi:hypothetical protein